MTHRYISPPAAGTEASAEEWRSPAWEECDDCDQGWVVHQQLALCGPPGQEPSMRPYQRSDDHDDLSASAGIATSVCMSLCLWLLIGLIARIA
jgi:hypothetical protein